MATLLRVPPKIRNKIYSYLLCGSETINSSMVPRMLSQVDICCEEILPGAGVFLTCKQLRKEAKKYLYRNTHFSARHTENLSSALQRFRFGQSICRIQSLELHTASIMRRRATEWSSELHIIVSKMQALKYLRISAALLGDDRDDMSLIYRGKALFANCGFIRACLLRFGAFVTLRHRSLKLLVWGEPTGDVYFSDRENGAVHYTVKILADRQDLQPTDVVMNSTGVRQYTIDELLSMQAEGFKISSRHRSSERTLPALYSTSNTLATRMLRNSGVSGIEHIVFLTRGDRKRIGLKKPLNLDELIMEARTGLLASKFSPYHETVRAGRVLAQAIKTSAQSSVRQLNHKRGWEDVEDNCTPSQQHGKCVRR